MDPFNQIQRERQAIMHAIIKNEATIRELKEANLELINELDGLIDSIAAVYTEKPNNVSGKN